MTTCILVLNLIHCVVVGPVPTPAQAAAILAPHQFVYMAPRPAGGPFLTVARSKTGPAWDRRELHPKRRLDGTLLSDPPTVYGIPYPWTPLSWAILHQGKE